MSAPRISEGPSKLVVPFERPRREDFDSSVDFIRAFHAFNQAVTNEANRAFTCAFRAAMKQAK